MYQSILVPTDLEHTDALSKSLETAIHLAQHYGAELCYAAVTPSGPSPVAPSPEAFEEALQRFAAEQGEQHGIKTSAVAIVAHDPAVELDNKLLDTIESTGADLVVMASHVPGLADKLHILRSNAGTIASKAKVSVFVVR
ncbi:universal stress protein [Algiphilus sp. NNCM1]|uniref:universal stress protein n=1 Tax=Algiphilus sp. TaxID=1872431 RepID=UPI001CA63479|nr:universal stress protein [Algiphilus sp.]MBY8966203.1 universal stress protein [Algiphilus acroporae]MCI5104673.1 universal stress protein [Algiphilus sp.]